MESVDATACPPRFEPGFAIVLSADAGRGRTTLVAPDAATCDDCLHELFDPADRRYRYPFVNCTNCGPRFTIVMSVPYDRARTTMAGFPLCAACRRELTKKISETPPPEPIACPACGYPLTARPYSYAYFIPVDKCLSCHKIWFDADELEILQVLIENR